MIAASPPELLPDPNLGVFTHERLLGLARAITAGENDELSHFPWIALAQGFLALDRENQQLQREIALLHAAKSEES